MSDAKVELVDLIDHVAKQLTEAARRAAERPGTVMQFKEATLELAVSLETGGTGGLKVWVLELGGGRTKTKSNTITVTLEAIPGREEAFVGEDEGSGPNLGPTE